MKLKIGLMVGCVAFAVIGVGAAAPAYATGSLPADKANFVVTIGNMATTSGVVKTDGWVRLAKYHFVASNTSVTETLWFWSHQNIVGRKPSGVTSSGCSMNCAVEVPAGFQDGSGYPHTFNGTYAY